MTSKLSTNFQVVTQRQGNTAYVVLSGELDIATAGELELALRELESSHPERTVLDLSELTFMDVTGLRVILAAAYRARHSNVSLVVAKPQKGVKRLFELTGADKQLGFFDEGTAASSSS